MTLRWFSYKKIIKGVFIMNYRYNIFQNSIWNKRNDQRGARLCLAWWFLIYSYNKCLNEMCNNYKFQISRFGNFLIESLRIGDFKNCKSVNLKLISIFF